MKHKKTLLVVIGLVILLFAGIAGGYLVFSGTQDQETKQTAETQVTETPVDEADQEESEKFYEDTKNAAIQPNETDALQNIVNFDELKKINPDVYAWINVPGTKIDYPILQSQGDDDSHYLNTTMEGKTGLPGSIYTEKYNAQDFTDPVTVVYGHNMKNGSMFSGLHQYIDKSFFDQNPYVYIYTPTYRYKYQIFAAVAHDDTYLLGNYSFTTQEDFEKYIGELRGSLEGNVNTAIEVPFGSYVLTLSTCISEYPEQRWLVNGILIETVPVTQ